MSRTARLCGHCSQPQRGFASVTYAGAPMPLCHPDDGPDCYRLVTVYHHPTPCDCSDHAAAMAMYQKNMARRDVGIARWDPARVLAEIKAKPPLPLPAIDTEETQP
jgi:hypothetical protein